jgi:hypothetical protein
MAIFSNIFLSFSTQNPRASASGQKSGVFQFFLKTKLMPEVSVFQQSTVIFYWGPIGAMKKKINATDLIISQIIILVFIGFWIITHSLTKDWIQQSGQMNPQPSHQQPQPSPQQL